MSGLTVYGTTTSPYVRRVRVVAAELGIDIELIDTAHEPGQSAMRALNPVWKVPTATVGQLPLLDSATICEHLVNDRSSDAMARFSGDNVHQRNLMTVIDGALDSLINVFYLGKDGVDARSSSYVAKQVERAASAMHWLEQWATGPWLSQVHQLGLSEVAMVTTIDWMRFRGTYDPSGHPKLMELAEHWSTRESFASTLPTL